MSRLKAFAKNKVVIIILLAAIIVIITNLPPQFVETFYSEGLYKGISWILHPLLGWLPFSVGDLIYIAVIGYLIYAVFNFFRLLFTARFKAVGTAVLKFFIGFEIAICLFYLLWGINYSRPAAADLLNLRDTSYTIKDVATVTKLLIDSTNTLRNELKPQDFNRDNSAIYDTAVSAVKRLSTVSPKYQSIVPRIKPSLITPLLNYLETSGYFNPFTGEAQLNWQMPVFDRPFTACHEMAHQIGFGREDEADFGGYLAGIRSRDKLQRYSAYYAGTIEFLRYLRRRDTTAHHQLKAMLNTGVRQDLKTDSLYWTKYAGQIGMISGRFYDNFLKANKQPAGLYTYNRMIRLTMAWYKREDVWK
ncbi:DUF3810 domain-containing protein [Mucilaginibacter sp. KACC 22063]|uniref:DUF3810 domain-containing protein n=1 Tax=Mucilaginibacter sp. KACC 22063 TaxID=3025666 RepID=UPI0023656D05|nr:DUF3810 domain-containing protein [Mucilaginibacter sp. KACC 22063]WDF55051.1 DUF3810 domain-containing protein [Mucilaginibacter sp. KACC 22063]